MKAVIFDLDGTLVHSAPDIHAAANVMLAHAGRDPVTLEQVIGFIGNGIEKLVERCMRATGGVPDDLTPHYAEMNRAYAKDLTTLTRLFEGVRETLDAIDVPMALCTNKPEIPTRDLCEQLGLIRYFNVITGGDSTPMKKPDPMPLVHTAVALGLSVEECLYVGDSVTDFRTARAAGMAFAYFTGGYQPTPVEGLKMEECFDSWRDIDLSRFAQR